MIMRTVKVLALSAMAMSLGLAAPATRDEVPPVEKEDCCAEYYACIDACAADDAERTDFCDDTYDEGSDKHAGCMGLADHEYESCLEDCGERPPGC